MMVANFSPDGSLATPHWSTCPPAGLGSCRAVFRAVLRARPEPAGTVFTAIAIYRGRTHQASVTWRGRVTALTAPRVVGAARIGARVRAAAGTWRGGWGDEFDQLGLEACRTRNGGQCVMLSGGQYGCPAGSSRTVLGRASAGRYLFALDLRSPRDEACAGVAYSSPAAIPPWPHQRIVARSAPAGPVAG